MGSCRLLFDSIAVRALVHGANGLTFRLVSEPCFAPAGDSRAAPPTRNPSTLREAVETDARGSTVVGMALYRLAGLAVRGLHYESFHGPRLASARAFAFSGRGRFDMASRAAQ